VVGSRPIDPGTVARIMKTRGAAAGFDPALLSGHSLKRGVMNTAKDCRVHPARLKQLGRHASYATLGAYLEEGDLFEDNSLNGVLWRTQTSCLFDASCERCRGNTRDSS
jgi:hypothetical protein